MILVAIFAALQVADLATTLVILKRGGIELNPIMARAMDAIGPPATLILTKLLVIGLAWYLQPYQYILGALCVYYAGVVFFNLRSVLK